jgi:GntR family transcriptional regulator
MSAEKDTKIDEVVEALNARLARGYYVAGQRLPAERELAEELKVSRVTIRAALQRLQAENLIDIVPRGGAFVRSSSFKAVVGSGAELEQAGTFVHMMEQLGRQAVIRFLEPSSIRAAGDEIGGKMHIDANTPVLRRRRLYLVDRVPYRILDSYYLASLFGDLLGKDEGDIPTSRWLLEHKGVTAAHASDRLQCRMPSAEEAKILNISRGQPVVEMARWVWDDHETLFEYTHIVANGALHELSYSYHLPQ